MKVKVKSKRLSVDCILYFKIIIDRWDAEKGSPHRYHRTLLYPSRFRNEMQCFYAVILDFSHPQSLIQIQFRLTNELVSNYEYFNGDGHVTSSIDPADDVVIGAAALRVELRAGAANWTDW